MRKRTTLADISQPPAKQLLTILPEDLMPLPQPRGATSTDSPASLPKRPSSMYGSCLDGVSTLELPMPGAEEDKLVQGFLNGLKKLLSKNDNWPFFQPLVLSLEYCANCQTCANACPIYLSSGRQEIYRPTYRSEVLRRIKKKYLDRSGKLLARFGADDFELNWATIARLAELAYRCTLCRRCAQACPLAVDNGLIALEIRKLFSQELGIAPAEFHSLGTVRQLEVGSSASMNPKAFKDALEFMEEEIEEKLGKKIEIPVDKKGADILLMHNAGELVLWPENVEAFAVIFDSAEMNWTLSSEITGYDVVNYGVWYDDVQLAKVATRHARIARELRAKKIVIGECGHAHSALIVAADRLLSEDLNVPRESCFPLLERILSTGKLRLNPAKNSFPVTLHDPCGIVRLTGIVDPQRKILKRLCPHFLEMNPHGTDNYCCGAGGGLGVIKSPSLTDWRLNVAGRIKVSQIMKTFGEGFSPEIKKYVCAPCSNCKSQIRSLLSHYELDRRNNVACVGLAELIVNAMETRVPWLSEVGSQPQT